MCRTSPLAAGALLQRHFVAVFDSVVRFRPPSTPLLNIARGFSFTCSAEMSATLVTVACFAVSFELRTTAIERLVLTILSCIARRRLHAF